MWVEALGTVANVGQLLQIAQEHRHQREQIRWEERGAALDDVELKVSLLGSARDDVRGIYKTYIEELDTLMLMSALIWPCGLSTLQISGDFMPVVEDPVEQLNPWLELGVVYAMGFTLILPFWAILMLVRCKCWMDSWLKHVLGQLQGLRREATLLQPCHMPVSIPERDTPESAMGPDHEPTESSLAGHDPMVSRLFEFVRDYQGMFSERWAVQCAPLVRLALWLIAVSIVVQVVLVGLVFWIYLKNKQGEQNIDNVHFLWVLLAGLMLPLVWFLRQGCLARCGAAAGCGRPPAASTSEGAPATSCRTRQRPPACELVASEQSEIAVQPSTAGLS